MIRVFPRRTKWTPTEESALTAFSKIGGICYFSKKQLDDPDIRKPYYILAILKNRVYVNEKMFWSLIKQARQKDIDLDECIEYAKIVRNWTEWRSSLEKFIESNK